MEELHKYPKIFQFKYVTHYFLVVTLHRKLDVHLEEVANLNHNSSKAAQVKLRIVRANTFIYFFGWNSGKLTFYCFMATFPDCHLWDVCVNESYHKQAITCHLQITRQSRLLGNRTCLICFKLFFYIRFTWISKNARDYFVL